MRAAPSIFSFCAPRTLCAQDVADLQSGLATSHQPIHTRYRILLIPYRFVFALLRRYQVQRSNVSRGSPCITVRLNEQPAHRISSPMPQAGGTQRVKMAEWSLFRRVLCFFSWAHNQIIFDRHLECSNSRSEEKGVCTYT